MLRLRIYGLVLGYEDLNDHESLRKDLRWPMPTKRSEELTNQLLDSGIALKVRRAQRSMLSPVLLRCTWCRVRNGLGHALVDSPRLPPDARR